MGHTAKLIASQLAKPSVKPGKNDAADAEALCKAMSRPTMRFVPAETADQQAALVLAGQRERLVRGRTRLSNTIRGTAAEFGMLPGAVRGLPFDRRIDELLADRDNLAPIVRPMLLAWRQLREQIAAFDKAVRALAKARSTAAAGSRSAATRWPARCCMRRPSCF